MSANVQTMMYVKDVPWHGKGVRLEKLATAAEAITAAGLDWRVRTGVLYATDGVAGELRMPVLDKRAIYREDTHDVLGVVGARYQLFQNREAFDFHDAVVGTGQAIYETAGALGRGERIWMLSRVPGDIQVAKDDAIARYLLLYTSHDGTGSVRMLFTPVRVVCQNTLTAALRRGQKTGVSLRHTGNLRAKVKDAQEALGLAVRYYDDFGAMAQELAGYKIKGAQLDAFYKTVVPDPQPKRGEDGQLVEANRQKAINTRTRMLELFGEGAGNDLPGVRGTAWAAVNSVTEYVDHVRGARGDQSNRLRSMWFGSGARMKAEALHAAMELVGVKVS